MKYRHKQLVRITCISLWKYIPFSPSNNIPQAYDSLKEKFINSSHWPYTNNKWFRRLMGVFNFITSLLTKIL